MPQASTAAVNDSAPSDRDDGQFDWLPSRNWGWIVARGMVLVLLGILAILAPGVTLFAFAMLFAALSFVDGIFALIAGIRGARREERWGAMVFSGILGIGIGILFLLFPLLSTLALAYTTVLLIAVWAILMGVFEVAAAIRLRKVIEGEWLLALAGVLSVVVGIAIAYLLATNPGISVLSVAWLIAFYAFVSGIALIVLGFRLRKATR